MPDGRTVNTADIYTSAFHKTKGCDIIIVTELLIKHPFSVSLPKDTCFINSNTSIILKVVSLDTAVNYLWQDGSNLDHFNASAAGVYHVKVFNDCYSTIDSINIYENCALPIYIPNAFTPNHDGRNDVLRIGNMHGQQLLSFNIYNRFGEKIFSKSDENIGWNGDYKNVPQPMDEYMYLLTYVDLKGAKKIIKNTVVLIR